jgi:magnesium chelatase family protein
MNVLSFVPLGFDGELVSVEVDLRHGLPGTEIVGLPGAAVREARERIRVAVANSGFLYPPLKILINLSPADVPKFGAGFDLAIAVALLCQSGQIPSAPEGATLAIGELLLDGSVRPARGVLSAVAVAYRNGIGHFTVAREGFREAQAFGKGRIAAISHLRDLRYAFLENGSAPNFQTDAELGTGTKTGTNTETARSSFPMLRCDASEIIPNYRDMRGRPLLKRACEIAAAGRHNLLLSGPPGCGKTMAAERLAGLCPDLSHEQAVEVARIYSTAGLFQQEVQDGRRPPVRAPHHTASPEGVIGGGRYLSPGELSLAHNGILILDEAPEFRRSVLQGLREPLEKGMVRLIRAERRYWYPADIQLIMTANACPCGNYGALGRRCMCSLSEIHNYRKKLGAALLDRVEIRVWQTEDSDAAEPSEIVCHDAHESTSVKGTFDVAHESSSEEMSARVHAAVAIQRLRHQGFAFERNGRVPGAMLRRFVKPNSTADKILHSAVPKLGLSSRAVDAVLRVARTIADLDGEDMVNSSAIMEAIQLRRDDR